MTYGQLNECAGPGHFMRVGRDVAVGWKIPGFMKAQLVEVGIPVAPRLVEQVVMQSEADPVLLTSRGPLYCRMGGHGSPAQGSACGSTSFVVTAVALQPQSFSASRTALRSTAEEEEERAFAELNRLAEELKEVDPAAFNGYEVFSGQGSWAAGSLGLGRPIPALVPI
ncbi:MAG: hypothetical protein ACI39M_11995 [Streptomyces albidoflavus]